MKNEIKKRVLYCGYGLLDSHVALAFPSVSQVKVGNKSSTGSPFLERIWPVLIIDLTYVTFYSVCNFHKQFTKTRNNQTCKYLKYFLHLDLLARGGWYLDVKIGYKFSIILHRPTWYVVDLPSGAPGGLRLSLPSS